MIHRSIYIIHLVKLYMKVTLQCTLYVDLDFPSMKIFAATISEIRLYKRPSISSD